MSCEFRPLSLSWVCDQEEKRWRWEEERYQFTTSKSGSDHGGGSGGTRSPWFSGRYRRAGGAHKTTPQLPTGLPWSRSARPRMRLWGWKQFLVILRSACGNFSGGSGVKIPHFQCRGHGFHPWSENWDSACHVTRPKSKHFLKSALWESCWRPGDKQKSAVRSQGRQDGGTRHFPSAAVGLHRFVTAYQAELERGGRCRDGGGRQGAKTPQDAQVELAICPGLRIIS